MEKHPNRLLMIVLLLGWIADFLFWSRPAGVNFAIFLTLCLLGGTYLLLADGLRPASKSLWLLLPFGFFVVMTFLRREPLSAFLAYTFTLVPLGMLVNTYLGGRWMQYSMADYVNGLVKIFASLFTRPLKYFVLVREERAKQGMAAKGIPFLAILRGLLIALPILVIFGSLLASADLIFARRLADFFGLFNLSNFSEDISRVFYILAYAYGLTGVFLLAAAQSRDEKLLGENGSLTRRLLGFTEASIVLGSVILLFSFFVAIQFRYFFGGNENIGISTYSYSEYARRGFNELVTVAFFSLVMVLGLSTLTHREREKQKRIYSGLNVAIVGLVMVILFSAYQRLMLAIDWHGYSRLRLYPRVFMIWLGILLIVVVILEIMDRQRNFAFAAILASLGFALTISIMNVDGAIVHHNIWRALQGRHFNVPHLASLSSDAVPVLVDEFLSPSLPIEIREGVGAALACQQFALQQSETSDWRSFHASDWLAMQALQKAQDDLAAYKLNDSRGFVRVRTPGNAVYDCQE